MFFLFRSDEDLRIFKVNVNCPLSGLTHIEATAFVSPKWVPQMADHGKVLRQVVDQHRGKNVTFPVLVPNIKGLGKFLRCLFKPQLLQKKEV